MVHHMKSHGLLYCVAMISFYCQITLGNQSLDAGGIFSEYAGSVYQIRVIERQSGIKAAIGSGFVVSANYSMITNYHVVAQYVLESDKYQLEAHREDASYIRMRVQRVDVINDLAIIEPLHTHEAMPASENFLKLANHLAEKGDTLFSLGNPHDLGFTVVSGTYNGYVSKAYYARVLFSGAINPGMSGGPVLNKVGQVVGVNVATAGNEIGFLVPLEKVSALLHQQKIAIAAPVLSKQISDQIDNNEKNFMEQLIKSEWRLVDVGRAKVIGEMTDFVSCWGDVKEGRNKRIKSVYNRCRSEGAMYLSPHLTTGMFEYEFNFFESQTLTRRQFYQWFQNQITQMLPSNVAYKNDVTNFTCHEDVVVSHQEPFKMVICAREYNKYPGLFDVLFLSASLKDENYGLVSHFFFAGIKQKSATQFTQKFIESIRWIQ